MWRCPWSCVRWPRSPLQKPAIEGAGVRLRRAFGTGDGEALDPFLLFDDFRNQRPEAFRAGVTGPVEGVAIEPLYLDVSLPADGTATFEVAGDRTCFAYVFAGSGRFATGPVAVDGSLVRLGAGDEVRVQGLDGGVRFLLVSGRPLGEPIAWRGPIVMNTEAELRQAFDELRDGTFLRPPA